MREGYDLDFLVKITQGRKDVTDSVITFTHTHTSTQIHAKYPIVFEFTVKRKALQNYDGTYERLGLC